MSTQAPAQDPARTAMTRWGEKAYEKPTDVTAALAQLAEHFPVVAPGGTTKCAAIAEGCRVLVTSVIAYPPERGADGKEIQGTGDVFKDAQTGKWCFHAAFLKKLAAGVGIEWLAEKTRRLDNFAHPFVCSMVVAGRYRDYTGDWREISGRKLARERRRAGYAVAELAALLRCRPQHLEAVEAGTQRMTGNEFLRARAHLRCSDAALTIAVRKDGAA